MQMDQQRQFLEQEDFDENQQDMQSYTNDEDQQIQLLSSDEDEEE